MIFQPPLALPDPIKFSIGGEGGFSREGWGAFIGEAKNEPQRPPLALHVEKLFDDSKGATPTY